MVEEAYCSVGAIAIVSSKGKGGTAFFSFLVFVMDNFIGPQRQQEKAEERKKNHLKLGVIS